MKLKWLQQITTKFKQIAHLSDQKKYLRKLIENIEQYKETGKNIPFKIVDVKEHGYLVKTGGLFAYVPFKLMPWDYKVKKSWSFIFPAIKDRVFFGKICQLEKDPLFIKIDAKIPQFKNPQLIENGAYQGIVLNKTPYGLFVDIGYHFDWRCGSLVGLLHKSQCKNHKSLNSIKPGQEIKIYFWGYNENHQPIFADNAELKEWYTGEIKELIGLKEKVKVTRYDQNRVKFIIRDKYQGILPVNKGIYPNNTKQVKRIIDNLKDNDIIDCEIIDLHPKSKTLRLKLILKSNQRNNSLSANRLNNDIIEPHRKNKDF